jgi:hypothetical protein
MRILITTLLSLFICAPTLAEHSSTHFNQDSFVALNAYRGLVEEHIEGVARSLRLIASTDEAKSAKWDTVKPLVTKLSSELPTDAASWLALPDGSYHTSEPEEAGIELNIKDRPYFSSLMSGTPVFGDLVISKSTGHRSVIIAVPVLATDGKTVAAVGVSLRVRLLSDLVGQCLKLTPREYFYALHETDTKIVLHSFAERMFKTPSDVGDEALGARFKEELKHDHGSFEYELNGNKIASIFELSPKLKWYFFLAREISAP